MKKTQPLANDFPLRNPELATREVRGSVGETGKKKGRVGRRRENNRRSQGNNARRLGSRNSTPNHSSNLSRGPSQHYQGNGSGSHHAPIVPAASVPPPFPSNAHGSGSAPSTPTMRYGPASAGNTNPNARHPGTFQIQPCSAP